MRAKSATRICPAPKKESGKHIKGDYVIVSQHFMTRREAEAWAIRQPQLTSHGSTLLTGRYKISKSSTAKELSNIYVFRTITSRDRTEKRFIQTEIGVVYYVDAIEFWKGRRDTGNSMVNEIYDAVSVCMTKE